MGGHPEKMSSGDMAHWVPTKETGGREHSVAKEKSDTSTLPRASIRMFSRLMSRWTMPRAWMWHTAERMGHTM